MANDAKKHPTVMISFRLGDLNPKAIEFTDGDGQSRSFATIDARLLIAKSIKVNGEVFHRSQYDRASQEASTGEPQKQEQTEPEYGAHRQ